MCVCVCVCCCCCYCCCCFLVCFVCLFVVVCLYVGSDVSVLRVCSSDPRNEVRGIALEWPRLPARVSVSICPFDRLSEFCPDNIVRTSQPFVELRCRIIIS